MYLSPSGKVLGELVHGGLDRLGGRQRVRAGQLEDAERDRGIAIEIGVGGVVEGGQLHARDILQAHHGRGRLLHQDVGELVGIGEPAQRLHRHLEGARLVHRRLAEHARGDLDVLALQGGDDVPVVSPSDCSRSGSSHTRME